MNVVLCDDLIFASRIVGAGRAVNVPVRHIRNLNDLDRETPACAMIDLHFPGLDIQTQVLRLKSLDPPAFLVGFGSHVDAATLKAAREAGCDLVWPRSKFVEELEVSLPIWCGSRAGI